MLLGYLMLSPLFIYVVEQNSKNIYAGRLWVLSTHTIFLALLFSPLVGIEIAGYVRSIAVRIGIENPDHMVIVQAYLFGGLLVMNEMNVALRYLIKMLNLAEIGEDNSEVKGDEKYKDNISAKEYNTGRVIGMIERLFIYIFTLSGQFAAIGFILTAKGIVRYHEFEDRTFAEYVLIGTLLSALLAMGSALLVQLFL